MGYLQRVKLLAALQKVIADKPEQSDKLLQFKKMLYDYTDADTGIPDLDEFDPSDKKQLLKFVRNNPQVVAPLNKKLDAPILYRAIMMEYSPDALKKIYTGTGKARDFIESWTCSQKVAKDWITFRRLSWVFSLVLAKKIPEKERIVYLPSLPKKEFPTVDNKEQEVICFPQKITPKDIECFQIWLPVDFEDEGDMFEWGDYQDNFRKVKLWTCSSQELGELMEMKVNTEKDQNAFAWEILRRAKHKKALPAKGKPVR